MKKGFTLVELLIVITIIAILSGVGLTFFQQAQAKVRDTKRKEDLRNLGNALELYRQVPQHSDQYIVSASQSCNSTDTTSFYLAIASYMSNQIVPTDPKTGGQYCYYSENNGNSYRLYAKLENC